MNSKRVLAIWGRCYACLAAFGSARSDGSEVTDSSDGDGRCSRCAVSCECCDSEEEHEAAVQESMQDFLNDPGPPPAGMSEKSVARARSAIAEERAKRKAVQS